MIIGVGVEGPSDLRFWTKVLHKHLPHVKFDVRNMKNRSRLIRETNRLLESFRHLHYNSCLVLLDRDSAPCNSEVLSEFDELVRSEATKPLTERYLHILIAVRELEAWYLADEQAIQTVFPNQDYQAPHDTSELNAERVISSFWKSEFGGSALNKIELAGLISPKFSPQRAMECSTSFMHTWKRITFTVSQGSGR
ncbi:MAG: DUF4276 family protein [Candidatus Zixiibacteriota bacterium]